MKKKPVPLKGLSKKDIIQAEKIATTWRTLNNYIKHLSVQQLEYLIKTEYEKENPRNMILKRLIQRYGVLKAEEAVSKVTTE